MPEIPFAQNSIRLIFELLKISHKNKINKKSREKAAKCKKKRINLVSLGEGEGYKGNVWLTLNCPKLVSSQSVHKSIHIRLASFVYRHF